LPCADFTGSPELSRRTGISATTDATTDPGAATRTIERYLHHRVASTGAVVVTAVLAAVTSGGCFSDASKSASNPVPSTTTSAPTTISPTTRAPLPRPTGPSVIIDATPHSYSEVLARRLRHTVHTGLGEIRN
jgi:hypothetical protein